MKDLSRREALILIDVQVGFDDNSWGIRNNPDAEIRMADLLNHWRIHDAPVFHIQHISRETDSPLRPNQPGVEFKISVAPHFGEKIIRKHVNSAFIGTELVAVLRKEGIENLVVIGLTTDHCVSTTVRMGANLGFKMVVVADATATFNRIGIDGEIYDASTVHALALASLAHEFATVCTSSLILSRKPGSISQSGLHPPIT